jgi:hypothetical protein
MMQLHPDLDPDLYFECVFGSGSGNSLGTDLYGSGAGTATLVAAEGTLWIPYVLASPLWLFIRLNP